MPISPVAYVLAHGIMLNVHVLILVQPLATKFPGLTLLDSWAFTLHVRSVKFKCLLNNAKNVSIDQVMLYLVKLEELHLRKLSCTL